MIETDCVAYTPAWIDDLGNRVVFPSKANLFDCSGLAHAQLILTFAFYRAELGLKMDGVFKLKVEANGDLTFPHVEVTYNHWSAYCVSGPVFDHASGNQNPKE
jgi:hypothetical protein